MNGTGSTFVTARDLLDQPFRLGEDFEVAGTLNAELDDIRALRGAPGSRRGEITTASLFEDLEDAEFEVALDNLVAAVEQEADRLGAGESTPYSTRSVRHLERWLAPLAEESERLLGQFADELHGYAGELEGAALDELIARAIPAPHTDQPVFDDFLGGLLNSAKKAVTSAAKKVATVAAKLDPITAVLGRLKQLVRPLLKRVLSMALNKLPPLIRPYAATLAASVGLPSGPNGSPIGSSSLAGIASRAGRSMAPGVRGLATQFRAEMAAVALAAQGEFETLIDEIRADAARESTTQEELDEARERFIDGLQELREGQDATPLVQEFLPAALPVLKLGISLAGRDRVVRTVAGFLGPVVSRYVGARIAPALSKAIVDTGLRMVDLEADDEEADDTSRGLTPRGTDPDSPAGHLAAEAFANLVADTARVVSELGESELGDDLALEAATYEGLLEGVVASLPPDVLASAPAAQGSTDSSGVWVSMPRSGAERYRKHSRVFPVQITDSTARSVKTFGGRSLDAALRTVRTRPGPLNVRIHLVQAVPGSRARRILDSEASTVPGLTISGHELHPLTPDAAGLLLGDPGLGRDVAEEFAEEADALAAGERLYFLEIADLAAAGGRPSDVGISVDETARELRIALFRSETDAQHLASALRTDAPLGASTAALLSSSRPRLEAVLADPARRVRFASVAGGAPRSDLLSATGATTRVLVRALQGWVTRALPSALVDDKDALIAATESTDDGITLLFRFANPPGFSALAALLRGQAPGAITSTDQLRRTLTPPATWVVTVAGGNHRA